GHAIEAASGYARYLHGEAVAIGMAGAARLATRLGLLGESDARRQDGLLDALGLPLAAPGLAPAEVWGPMRRDKKARRASLRWVLLQRVGSAAVRGDVPEPLVDE